MQRKATIVPTSSSTFQNTWNSWISNPITHSGSLKLEKFNQRSESGDWRRAVGHPNFLASIFRGCYPLTIQYRNWTDKSGCLGFNSGIARKAAYSDWIASFSFEFFLVGRGVSSLWGGSKFIEIKLVMIAVYNTII